ncbi:MAG: cbb3-type cytochrome c oxidase subunit I [Acidobacteriota bacterium]
MFVSGQSQLATVVLSALTFLVAIPSGVKVFNWLTTMYRGNIVLQTPMLYAIAFLILFAIGGLTGIFLGTLSTDVHLTDTYFVVAHFHYVMMGSTVTAFIGGLFYWWPKMTGRMFSEKMGRISCILWFIGFNATFHSAVHYGQPGHASPVLQLPGSIPGVPRVFDGRQLDSSDWRCSRWRARCSLRCASPRMLRTIRGEALRLNGRPRRRRSRTTSTISRFSNASRTIIVPPS